MQEKIENKENTPSPSRAIKIIQMMRKKKKFIHFWNEYLSRDYSYILAYKYSSDIKKHTGCSIPPLKFIVKLSPVINPALWFYSENEELPLELPEGILALDDYTQSRNFKKLENIQQPCKWANENGYDSVTIWAIIKQKRKLTSQMIIKLKPYFPPENWFR